MSHKGAGSAHKVAAPAHKVAAPANKVVAPAHKPGPSKVVREESLMRKVHAEVVGRFEVREVVERRHVREVREAPMKKHSEAKVLKAPVQIPPKGESSTPSTGAAHKTAAKNHQVQPSNALVNIRNSNHRSSSTTEKQHLSHPKGAVAGPVINIYNR